MLTKLLKAHTAEQAVIRKRNERLKKRISKASEDWTATIEDEVNGSVSHLFQSQRDLEKESRKVTDEWIKTVKNVRKWLQLVDGLSGALKDLGDVQNWAQIIENDVSVIADTLELAATGTIQSVQTSLPEV